MKRRWVIVPLAAGLGAGLGLGRQLGWKPSSEGYERPPTIEQVRELASLVTTRVQVADVQETDVFGYTGGMRVLMVVQGDFLMGVDLSASQLRSVDASARSAVLLLPQPSVTSARVDHRRTKLFEVSSQGLWMLVPSDAGRFKAIERAYAQAQRAIADRSADPDLQAQSRRQATRLLQTFFAALGWRLTVRWGS